MMDDEDADEQRTMQFIIHYDHYALYIYIYTHGSAPQPPLHGRLVCTLYLGGFVIDVGSTLPLPSLWGGWRLCSVSHVANM